MVNSSYDLGVLGNSGSSHPTPQKNGMVEMDPVELFRLRCLRSKVRIKWGDVRKELGRAKCFKTENVSKY